MVSTAQVKKVAQGQFVVSDTRCCGQVGRGGNTVFSTFCLVLTNRPTDRWTNRRTNGWTDKACYRVACPQLKI